MAQRGRGRTGPPVSLWSKLSGVLTQQPIISHVTGYSCRHLFLEEGRVQSSADVSDQRTVENQQSTVSCDRSITCSLRFYLIQMKLTSDSDFVAIPDLVLWL